jgi:hypothetical protein
MSEKSPGSDMKFVFWDDPGDSQEHVDRQCSCKDWQKEIVEKELGKTCCSNHARDTDEEERKAEQRMRIILQNGNTGEHYPEYKDYLDDTDEE